jgi:hypothetical protein
LPQENYLEHHHWESEVLQSFVPTALIAGLAILVPLILLLVAKKAHTILTLSELHDRIMIRYYKFLILNVLGKHNNLTAALVFAHSLSVFFCAGTAVLQTFLNFSNLKDTVKGAKLIQIVAQTFPTAGPFYVGWLIFTTALHGGFEIILRTWAYITSGYHLNHLSQLDYRSWCIPVHASK